MNPIVMKKIIGLLFICALCLAFKGYANDYSFDPSISHPVTIADAANSYSQSGVQIDINLLVGKWKMTRICIEGVDCDDLDEEKFFVFFRDGRVQVKTDGEVHEGKWYVSSDGYLSFDNLDYYFEGIVSIHIEMLNSKKMVWKYLFDGGRSMGTAYVTLIKE